MKGVLLLGACGCLTGVVIMLFVRWVPALLFLGPALAPVLGATIPLSVYTREPVMRLACVVCAVGVFQFMAINALPYVLGLGSVGLALATALTFLAHGAVIGRVFGIAFFWLTILSFAGLNSAALTAVWRIGSLAAPGSPLSIASLFVLASGTTAAAFGPAWQRKRAEWWEAKFGPPRCACGYNLTCNVSGVCPECGSPIAVLKNDSS